MSSRIFVESHEIEGDRGDSILISGDNGKYITRVLRLRQGDPIVVCSGDNLERSCTIAAIKGRSVALSVSDVREVNRESPLQITLCQALPKGKKMDLIIQKGTELGASSFAPFISSRSVSRPAEGEARDKVKRWEKIALEGVRQCGRNSIPVVERVRPMERLLEEIERTVSDNTLKVIPWECEETRGIKELSSLSPGKIVILIGPEGGFSAEEVETAKRAGFIPVSLGRRLLRTETAGLATISIVQYIWGDMG